MRRRACPQLGRRINLPQQMRVDLRRLFAPAQALWGAKANELQRGPAATLQAPGNRVGFGPRS
jgi:hypothetical protein